TVAAGGVAKAGVGNEGAFVEVWDWGKEKPQQKLEGFEVTITGVAFSPDGKQLAAIDQRGRLRVWDLADGKLQHEMNRDRSRYWSVAFHPTRKFLAFGCEDGTGGIGFWDPAVDPKPGAVPSGGSILTNSDPRVEVLSVAFSRDGKYLAAGGLTGELTVP